ncbi:MAG: phage holin family protein [Aquamicrobium sp.]|jgi:hypothetical protein|nr:phage holin family protein [Aquamicrobium sp.]
MARETDGQTAGGLLTDLVQQFTGLLSTEAQLLRAELRDSVDNLKSGAMEVIAGAICLLAALLVLLQALVAALAEMGLGVGWASLAVGVVIALFGVILLKRGQSNLSARTLAPTRTAHQLNQDIETAKEQVP